ncbi:MAG: helix-turn-helix domain-containing protein [Lentisphaerae bacterium]|nr:helix-turn-helix domain-containing protein [Lentisphaerota bacterium]
MKTTTDRQAMAREPLSMVEIRVADRIRQLRGDTGYTLADLAEQCELSASYLSRVENHKASVPLANLERLAQALGVQMTVFFEDDAQSSPLCICRRGEGKKARLRGRRGYPYELLAHLKSGKLLEPMIVDVISSTAPSPLSQHPGEEFNYVLEGECLLFYGRDRIHLTEGDSVYYDATIPHGVCTPQEGRCRILVTVASRDYLFHGDLKKLLRGELS